MKLKLQFFIAVMGISAGCNSEINLKVSSIDPDLVMVEHKIKKQ